MLYVLGHPRTLECLGIVTPRKELIVTLVLAALLFLLARPRTSTFLAAALCACLAPFAKETAIVLPALALLTFWWTGSLKKRWRSVAGIAVCTVVATLFRLWLLQHATGDLFVARTGQHASHVLHADTSWFWAATNSLIAWVRYLVVPFTWHHWAIEPRLLIASADTPLPAIGAWAVGGATIAALYRSLRKPPATWVLALLWITLSLSLVLVPQVLLRKGVFLYTNHYLYLALPGFAIALMPLLATRIGRVIFTAILLSGWFMTAQHRGDFSTEERFWRVTLAENPVSIWANGRLANHYKATGQSSAAEHHYRASLGWFSRIETRDFEHLPIAFSERPDVQSAMANYAALLLQTNRSTEAALLLKRTLALDPDQPSALTTQAALRFGQHRYPEALQLLRRADRAHPGSAAVWYNIGNCHYRMGHFWEALEAWETAQALPFCPPEAAQKAAEVSQRLQER